MDGPPIGLLPTFVVALLIIVVLLFIRSRLSPSTSYRRKRTWKDDDNSNYPVSDSTVLATPPEPPLSIFPSSENYSDVPTRDQQMPGIDLDTYHNTIDYGSGGGLDSGVSDSTIAFESSTAFDSNGFGGGGDFGGGGAGGDWGSSSDDDNN